MDLSAVMQELESRGSAQTRKTYARHGVSGPMFGVSYRDLGILVKRLKRNHPLALELWKTENHDARILATMLADPAALRAGVLNHWMKEAGNYVVGEAVAGVIARSSHGLPKADKWRASKREWLSCAGWNITSRLATNGSELDDKYFTPLIAEIVSRIHHAPNRTRHAMNQALIAIGVRSPQLQKLALAAAKKIGKVEVDHGDTNCKTPDAATYINKTAAHRKQRATKQNAAK